MPTTTAKIAEATSTKTELSCNDLYEGQVTLDLTSSIQSIINVFILFIIFARVERLELPANGFGDHYSTN